MAGSPDSEKKVEKLPWYKQYPGMAVGLLIGVVATAYLLGFDSSSDAPAAAPDSPDSTLDTPKPPETPKFDPGQSKDDPTDKEYNAQSDAYEKAGYSDARIDNPTPAQIDDFQDKVGEVTGKTPTDEQAAAALKAGGFKVNGEVFQNWHKNGDFVVAEVGPHNHLTVDKIPDFDKPEVSTETPGTDEKPKQVEGQNEAPNIEEGTPAGYRIMPDGTVYEVIRLPDGSEVYVKRGCMGDQWLQERTSQFERDYNRGYAQSEDDYYRGRGIGRDDYYRGRYWWY
jgi:hypothetical protein